MQGIVPEGEWDAFMETLRKPLPTTFRINGRGRFAADLRDRLQQDFFSQFSEHMEVGACGHLWPIPLFLGPIFLAMIRREVVKYA